MMDEEMIECTDGWIVMNARTDKWMGGYIHGWMDARIDSWLVSMTDA